MAAIPQYEEFRKHGKEMVDFICDYMKSLEHIKVMDTEIKPGFMAPMLPKEANEKPKTFEETMKEFNEAIMPGVLHWQSPNFFAYFGNGNSYPSLLADMLSTAMAPVGFSWASCPSITELETIMLDWFAQAIGLPQKFYSKNLINNSLGGGCIQGSASDAIYSVMFAARKRIYQILRMHEPESKFVAYASKQAHSCVEKAAILNSVTMRLIEPDENDRMTGDALAKQIEKDIADGYRPFFVCATLGTTGQGAFDHVMEIGKVCEKYPLVWLHCDGAYGGNSFLLPSMRPQGLELIDSIEVNPNKLMLTAFDCTCLWVKDVVMFTQCFAIEPLYLQHEHDKKVIDLRHYGVPLSRRFRSLKLFFHFRLFGLDRLREYIQRVIDMGAYFESLMKQDERFEIMNKYVLGVVCFRLKGADKTEMEKFLARCNSSGKLWMIPATARNEYIIRFVANQEFCNKEQIEAAFKAIQDVATEHIAKESAPSGEKEMDPEFLERFAFTRVITREEYEKQPRTQQLYDGATKNFTIIG